MSKRYETEVIRERLAEALQLPRPRLDTAAILDVYPNEFSAMMLGAIVGILSLFIGYMANAVGATPGTRAIAPFAVVLGVIGLIVGAVMCQRILTARKQYANERAFAKSVFDRVLSQPSAPNWHLYERLALRGALGNPEAADVNASLHEWTQARRQSIAEALTAAAGIQGSDKVSETGPETVAEHLPSRLFGKLTSDLTSTEETLAVDGQSLSVWHVEQPVTFQYRLLDEHKAGVTEAGHKMAAAGVSYRLQAVVTCTPSEAWYVLAADLVPAA